MKKIVVLGSGSWGTALSILLSKNGHSVIMWSFKKSEADSINSYRENREFLPGVELPADLAVTYHRDCVASAEMIVLAVPSNFIRSTMEDFLPFLKEGQMIVNVSKGLEDKSLLLLSEVIEEVAPMCDVAVLSGPSHAEEVSRGIPTTCVASAKNIEAAREIQAVFMAPSFRVYTNVDIIGVELGGALKNVIAVAAGASDGIGCGDNTKAALMTRGIVEIARLGVAMGAKRETFSGLAGIGDLIVTCTSMHSRNRKAGFLLGRGKNLQETLEEVHMVVEGVNTVRAAYELSLKYSVDMPITTEVYNVLFNNKEPKQAVYDLMNRDKNDEREIIEW